MLATHTHEKVIAVKRNASRDVLHDVSFFKGAFFTLRSVSHPVRKKILELLEKHAPLTVSEIYIRLRLEQSVASQHLSILRAAGVVKTERSGKFIFYSLNKERMAEIARHVEGLTSNHQK